MLPRKKKAPSENEACAENQILGTEIDEGDPVVKRKRFITRFTDEEEQSMIDWLMDYPVIYNKKVKNYKDTKTKERLWDAKAADICKSKLEVQTWYKSIRTRYGRLRKKKSESGSSDLSERDEWILSQFEFLNPFIAKMPSRAINVKAKATTQINTASPVDPLATSDDSALPDVYDEPTASPYKKVPEDDVYVADRMQVPKPLVDKPQLIQEVDSFCDYLSSVMYGFSSDIWRKCQMEMLQVILKYHELNDPQVQDRNQRNPLYVVADSSQSHREVKQHCCLSHRLWEPPPSP